MARRSAEALVLATRNWGEADKMASLLTRECGRVEAAAFGCRRPKSALAAGMQMFSHLDVELTEGGRVWTVRQCSLKGRFRRLSEDLSAMAYGSFVAELALELFPEHEPAPDAFDRLLQIFCAFEERNPRLVALAAAYQLLALAGLSLHLASCVHCGAPFEEPMSIDIGEGGALCADCRKEDMPLFSAELKEFIEKLTALDWQAFLSPQKAAGVRSPVPFSVRKQELLAAESLLLAYLRALFGKPLRSLAFIAQIGGA